MNHIRPRPPSPSLLLLCDGWKKRRRVEGVTSLEEAAETEAGLQDSWSAGVEGEDEQQPVVILLQWKSAVTFVISHS